jgi:hypothetical protein
LRYALVLDFKESSIRSRPLNDPLFERKKPLAPLDFVSRRSVTQNKAFSARFHRMHEPAFFRKTRAIFRNS